jgi:uncharacterized membrane protein YidH (DUF202 family)
MKKDIINIDELKLSDRLALERTIQAEGRSLLSWLRTSLSLIGFGFTIFKALQYLYQEGSKQLLRAETPRNIGLFLVITGTVPLLLAIIQYVKKTKQLGKKESLLLDPDFLAACVIFIFGTILILSLILKIRIL